MQLLPKYMARGSARNKATAEREGYRKKGRKEGRKVGWEGKAKPYQEGNETQVHIRQAHYNPWTKETGNNKEKLR